MTSGIARALPLLLAVPLWGQDSAAFEPQPAADYLCHLTQAEVTVAAEPYDEPQKVEAAFGRVDPNDYGFLPILVVISNDTDRIVDISELRVQLVTSGGRALDPVPADKLAYSRSTGRWGTGGPPIRVGPPWSRPRPHPLERWEIDARAFRSEFVSPHSFASGFFYFEAGSGRDRIPGARLYLRGFKQLPSGKELMYYEIDLSPYARQSRQEQTQGGRFREISSSNLLPTAAR